MAKRFGRNQRRKMRAEIERLATEKHWMEIQRDGARFETANAKQEALAMFIEKKDIYKDAILECSYAVGQSLGDELNKHKDKLLQIIEHEKPRLEFTFLKDIAAEREMLRVHIPLKNIYYQVIVK